MNTRRAFLRTAIATVAGGVMSGQRIAQTAEGKPLILHDVQFIRVRDRNGGPTDSYLEITCNSGHKGYAGPLLKQQVAAFPENLRKLLVGRNAVDSEKLNFNTLWSACHPGKPLESYAEGRDPLSGATAWGIKRATRHTESGWIITALSAIDLALWDLRGKAAGRSVWRLLGGTRERLHAYASMLGYSVKPTEARRVARSFFNQGFKRQKWFFKYGPSDGSKGLQQNIELVRALREELDAEALLMFDGIQYVWKSADVDYAIALAKGIIPYQPHWLEEPLRPDDLEGYTRLQGETGITLAAGEHLYTRWNVKPLLDRGILSFVQSDPEWCGGITEWLNICKLVKAYAGVQVIPHGHHVLGASTCVASQAEDLCPMMEYLIKSRIRFQRCQTRPLVANAGEFTMADDPGLGPSLDETRIERA